MPIRVVAPPVVEPVATYLAMQWCRAHDRDAELVLMLIQAARERAENTTQRVFVQRTLEWTGPGFCTVAPDLSRFAGDAEHRRAKLSGGGWPSSSMQIELATPVQSIESIDYIDANGTLQTLASSAYVLDAYAEPAAVRFIPGQALPAVAANRPDAVRIRFVAGYAPDLTDPAQPDYRRNLPAALLTWMQIQVSTWYTQRESLETGGRLVETSRNFVEAVLDGLIVSTRFV